MTRLPAPAVPMCKAAFEHPATTKAYRRLVRRRGGWCAASIIGPALLTTACISLQKTEVAISWVAITLLVSLPVIPFLAMGLLGAPRMARILQCYPWRAYPCRYVPRSRDYVLVLTIAPNHEVAIYTVPYRCDLRHKQNGHVEVIWFAGDPTCGGVASPAGGHFPQRVVTKPPNRDEPQPSPDDVAERAGLAKNGRYLRPWF
ncbi:hypothetical protein ACFU5O_06685 [Streptomyces sp. NPDC057445]|uniref:hypothetical protein n=1 Tax=Streptomyces sp. NPDC057445 TaxID=3346136 RepID=UPI00369F4445